jgi:hypothetical protein
MTSRLRRYLLSAGVLAVFAAVSAWAWLRAPYPFTLQRQLATEYLQLLENGDYRRADAMELWEIRPRQFCSAKRLLYTSPPQTNGNRLRRWLRGVEVEMPEVNVEFEGQCLLRVQLRRDASGQWKVARLTSHAG